MATPTPRKFQEKIAQLNERAAQGTAAFKDIMQEVSSLRNQQNRGHSYYPYGPLQGAMNDLQCLQQRYQPGEPNLMNDMQQNLHDVALRHNVIPHPNVHRAIHLTPPELLSRSSSDSSLHQTALQAKIVANAAGTTFRKGSAPEERSRHNQTTNYDSYKTINNQTIGIDRQIYIPQNRSSNIPIPTACAPATLGGQSAGPGGGSLPDLTQVQYMQSVGMPSVDGENAMEYKSMSGHVPQIESGISRSTFSRGVNGPYFRSPTRGASPGPSPRLSPVFDRKQKTKPYSHPPSVANQRFSMVNKNQLTVPSIITTPNFFTKAIATDNSPRIAPIDTHLANSGLNILGGPISPGGSHPTSPISFMDYRNPTSPQISPCASPVPQYMPVMTALTKYRTNSPDTRSAPPSPVSLQQTSSPASSPGVALVKPFAYDYVQSSVQAPATQQLNHQFQQITVIDSQNVGLNFNPAMIASNQMDHQQIEACGATAYYKGSASTSPVGPAPISNYPLSPTGSPSSTVIESSPGSQSHMHHVCSSPTQQSSPSHSPISPGGSINSVPLHPATPQTPQTPNVNLPRVVLTDQDGNDDRELLMNDMSELPAFLFEEFMLKNLSSLGEDELMTVDQIMVDTEIEESFRRDLRNTIGQDGTLMQNDQQFPLYETTTVPGQSAPINIICSETQPSPIPLSPQTDVTSQSSPQSQLSEQSPHSQIPSHQSPHCLTNLEPLQTNALLEHDVVSLGEGAMSQIDYALQNRIDLDLHSGDFDPINSLIGSSGHCNSNVSSWLSQANPQL